MDICTLEFGTSSLFNAYYELMGHTSYKKLISGHESMSIQLYNVGCDTFPVNLHYI